jgi:inhibitor of KinA sporulation pathway (predicted exonuclease)
VTDGPWDLKKALRGECARKGIPLAAHYSNYFDIRVEFLKRYPASREFFHPRPFLKGMLEYSGLNLHGRHHSGLDDCYSILQIVKKLLADGFSRSDSLSLSLSLLF